ncbi:MAG: PQQ-binding-like beta-propeller repeat protein [Verrucomicrobia bacterium]|nr:PQQ-binding-like beta-propeller repeat protein [Verrucomicrobiota bacterium]
MINITSKTTDAFKLGLHISLAGMVLGGGVVAGKDWPQFRGPNLDGKSSETGIIKSWETKAPELLWMGEGMGKGYAGVAVVGDRIYTTGNLQAGQGVVAVNAKDGKVLWSTVLTETVPKHMSAGSRCTPTVVGDHLWVTTSNGSIACLTTEGKLVWKKSFADDWGGKMMSGWGYSESVLVDGNAAVCTPGGPDAMMVALEKNTGKELWKCKVPEFGKKGKDGAGYSSVMISMAAGVKQYVQMIGRGVIGVRAADGKFLWGYDNTANNTANISSAYGAGAGLVKLDKDGDGVKATEVYFLNADTLQNHHGGMVLVDGYLYCGHQQNSGELVCLDIKTGKLMWGPVKPPGGGSAAVTYADGHLIFRYQDGLVVLVEATPKECKIKGSFKPQFQEKESWAHPVVSGGRLYLREQDKLMCYQL